MSGYPALDRLLRTEFHQDWQFDEPDPWKVIATYLRLASEGSISALAAELDRILARHLTERALRSLVLDEIESGWWVEDDGLTYRGWLVEFRRRAQAALEVAAPDLFTLGGLVGVYYCEDWRTYYGPDPWVVLAEYLSHTPTPKARVLFDQLGRVLAECPDEEALKSLIAGDLRCRYDPHADGWTYRGWLTEIGHRLRAELDHREQLTPRPDAAAAAAQAAVSDVGGSGSTAPASPPPRAASTWTNEAVAEATIDSTLEEHRPQISQWLAAGQRRTLAIAHAGPTVTGYHRERDGPTAHEVTGAMVVLRRLTSYPPGPPSHVLHSAYPAPSTLGQRTRLPQLRQFLGGYFNQDWAHIYGPDPWVVLIRYLADSSASEITATASQIDELLGSDLSEPALASLLLDELWCYYSADADGWTYRAWLTEVGRQARDALDTAVPGLFELGQLLGGYFGEDWPTRFGPDGMKVVESYFRGAPPETMTAVIRQVDQILAQDLTELALDSLLRIDLGSRYVPRAEGITRRDWLGNIRNQAHRVLQWLA